MATESELIDLLDSIGDRAPTVEQTLDRLAQQVMPTPSSHRRWLPIGAAAAALAAVAVSALVSVAVRDGLHHDAATAGPGPGPTVDRTTYALPLDAYYASASQMHTLLRAQRVLAQRCAQAHGVTRPAVGVPAGDAQAAFLNDIANDIRPLTLAQARTIGYGSPRSRHSGVDAALAGLTSQQREIVQGRTPAQKLAEPTGRFLFEGGCLGQAVRTLLKGATPPPIGGGGVTIGETPGPRQPGLFDDDDTVGLRFVNAARSGETTPAMGRAQHRWASCMAMYNYPGLHTTTDTIASYSSNLQSASARREAVQDVKCKQSTGFMTVWVASTTKAQNAVIAAHQRQLVGFSKRLDTRMANAAAALK